MAKVTEILVIKGDDQTKVAVKSAVKGQKNLGKATKAAGNTMAESATRFRAGMLKVVAALGVYKAIGWSAQLLRDADNIGKVADKIGLTTDELQELRFAAELANVPVAQLDMGMQRFSRRLGEAAQGMGELMGIAEQYDIQLRDSNGQMRSNIDVLNDFAEVIRNAESDQERLRIAFKLFDSEGAALVNILKDGSEALTTMRMKAQELGIVVEEGLIRNASDAQDELKILSMVIKAQLTTAVTSLAPEISAASQAMTDFVINWAAGVKVIKDFFTISQEEEVQHLEEQLERFTKSVVENKRILAGEGSFFESLRPEKLFERSLRDAEAAVVRITERLNTLRAEQQADQQGVGGGGGGDGGGGFAAAELAKANQEKVNAILADLRQQNLLAGSNDDQRRLLQMDIAHQARMERLKSFGATEDEFEALRTEDRRARILQQQEIDAAIEAVLEEERLAKILEDEMALDEARAELAAARGEQTFTQHEQELIALDDFYNAQIERLIVHGASMDEIEAARAQQQAARDSVETEQRLNTLQSRFQLMASLADAFLQLSKGQSRTAFEAYKIFATGDALISTYRGIAGALSMTPWTPFNFAQAALVGIQGFLQVQKIQSMTFGGGGSKGTHISRSGAGGGGAPGPGAAPPPTQFNVRLVVDVQPNDDFVTTITNTIADDISDGRGDLAVITEGP